MLYWINGDKQIESLPRNRRAFFEKHRQNLSDEEFELVENYIDSLIDKALEDNVEMFVPGQYAKKIWPYPLSLIWDKACNKNNDNSALWFGLLVMQVIIDRADCWRAVKVTLHRPVEQMVYFPRHD